MVSASTSGPHLIFCFRPVHSFRRTLMLKRILAVSTILLALALGAALAQEKNKGGGKAPAPPGMALSSPDFQDGGVIPDKFTQVNPTAPSPKLEWTNVPMGTQTFVLIMHDPDAALNKMPEDVLHWMAFNIPARPAASMAAKPRTRNCQMERFRRKTG